MVGWGDPFYLKFLVNRPRWSKITSFQPIFARSSSAVTPSERSSINTNRKSTTRFPTSLRWSSYVISPPKGVSKTRKERFPAKILLRLKKVCYKVPLCENCQRQSFKEFIGLTIRAKMIGGWTPTTWNFGSNRPRWSEIAVTPSEKSSVYTNRKSTTHFPVSPRWTSYVVPKPPKGGQKSSVQNLNNKLR